jgi:integrase
LQSPAPATIITALTAAASHPDCRAVLTQIVALHFLMLPDSKTGQKQIRLGTAAIDVLTRLPKVKGNPNVIVGRFDRERLINLQKPWRRIRKLAGIEDVRLHDLRHSFASVAAAAGGSLPMIGKLLGHNHPLTTARYAHLADDPLRELNERVADAISGALNSTRLPTTP